MLTRQKRLRDGSISDVRPTQKLKRQEAIPILTNSNEVLVYNKRFKICFTSGTQCVDGIVTNVSGMHDKIRISVEESIAAEPKQNKTKNCEVRLLRLSSKQIKIGQTSMVKGHENIPQTRSEKSSTDLPMEKAASLLQQEQTNNVADDDSETSILVIGELQHDTKITTGTNDRDKVIVLPDFGLNDVVWGKLRGYVAWPAKIINIDQNRYTVQWFNDYRTTKLFRRQVFKFYSNFEEFAKNFDKKIGLRTAAQEAMMFLANPNNDMRS